MLLGAKWAFNNHQIYINLFLLLNYNFHIVKVSTISIFLHLFYYHAVDTVFPSIRWSSALFERFWVYFKVSVFFLL